MSSFDKSVTERDTERDYVRNVPTSAAALREIPEYLDRLHAEIMKNREMFGMLQDKLAPVLSGAEGTADAPISPCETEMGSRLRDMTSTLSETNVYLNALWNRVQL
jgi:hypothetical protein